VKPQKKPGIFDANRVGKINHTWERKVIGIRTEVGSSEPQCNTAGILPDRTFGGISNLREWAERLEKGNSRN